MQHITGTAYGLVMRQGLANAQPVGAGRVRGMQRKGPGAASDGARGEVKADATLREDARHRPTAGQGGDLQPMGIEGAGRQRPASALERQVREPSPPKRPVALMIVASNTLIRTPRSARMSLVLV